jgi:PST family polysaccharide transporter
MSDGESSTGAPGAGSTERRFVESTLASYLSLLVRVLIKFGTRLVLARLILPEGHGLYELALRTVIIASAARDLGLPFHLMRDRRKPYGTVLAITVGQGALLTLLVFSAAPLTSFLDPELPKVLRVFAPWILLDALVAVPRVFFERELRLSRLVAPEVARGLIVAGVSIGMAAVGWGVWSFVIADLAAYAAFAAILWWRAWRQLPLEVDLSLAPDLLRKSSRLFLVWIVLQLVTYIDAFMVAFFDTAAMVGQYVRAYELAFLTRQIVFPRALVPALVEYHDDPPRFEQAFRLGTVFVLTFEIVAGLFLFFNAEATVLLIFGEDWRPAIPLLRVLALVPFLDLFTEVGGEVLKVRHEDRIWLVIGLLNLVSLLVFGSLFASRWGALGMAAANFLLLGNALMAWRMYAIFGSGFRRLGRDLLPVYLVPLACIAPPALLMPAGSGLRLLVSGATAGLALAVLAAVFRRPLLEFLGRPVQ